MREDSSDSDSSDSDSSVSDSSDFDSSDSESLEYGEGVVVTAGVCTGVCTRDEVVFLCCCGVPGGVVFLACYCCSGSGVIVGMLSCSGVRGAVAGILLPCS